jgi:hypothetical protein
MMMCSEEMIANEVELDFADSGELLRKGTTEFSWLSSPLDA